MEDVGTLKFAVIERTDIYSVILSYPGNPHEKKVPCKFFGKDFDGNA